MPRFALLEHVGHPDDPAGRHFDLLLEDGDACRTWRLATVPRHGGGPVAAAELPRHRLEWLDTEQAAVSGGRGVARRIDAGFSSTDGTWTDGGVTLCLDGRVLHGRLRLEPCGADWTAALAED